MSLADAYRLPKGDRASLLELTELAGLRSLADELAWVTSHKFRKNVSLMPNTYLLELALRNLDAERSTTVFVGDTVSNMQAGASALIWTGGYANKIRKWGATWPGPERTL